VYSRYNAVPSEVRRNFDNDQRTRLRASREPAAALLPEGVDRGFLGSAGALDSLINKLNVVRGKADTLELELNTDLRRLDDDRTRVEALMKALGEMNQDLVRQRVQVTDRLAVIEHQLTSNVRRRDELTERESQLLSVFETRPSAIEMKSAETQRVEAQGRLDLLRQASGDLAGEIARVEGLIRSAEADVPKPGGPDTVLSELNAQRDREQRALAELDAPGGLTASARTRLESALDAFAEEVKSARSNLDDASTVLGYVESAQKLQKSLAERTDTMVRRQEQMVTRLAEFRRQLAELTDEQQQARESSDAQLVELQEQLGIQQRRLNVAVQAGEVEEIETIQAGIRMLENAVAARRERLADPRVVALRQKLEEMIGTTEREFAADRLDNDRVLAEMSESFLRQQPAVEQLPEDQQKLTESLANRLAAVTLARDAYNRSLEEAASDREGQRKQIRERLEQLSRAIERRTAELDAIAAAGASAEARLAQLRSDLVDLTTRQASVDKQAAEARAVLLASEQRLADYMRRRDAADAAAAEIDNLRPQRVAAVTAITQLENERIQLRGQLDTLISPAQQQPYTVSVTHAPDRRNTASALAAGLIGIIGVGALFLMIGRTPEEAYPATARPQLGTPARA
jgi:chromosome segregation ATPase